MMAMQQISQNPAQFKENPFIMDIGDKDKVIREFQKFKKIKKIEIPAHAQVSNPNAKEKTYEATIMTLDGGDHVYRFVTQQKMQNSAWNGSQNVPQVKLISFQQIS